MPKGFAFSFGGSTKILFDNCTKYTILVTRTELILFQCKCCFMSWFYLFKPTKFCGIYEATKFSLDDLVNNTIRFSGCGKRLDVRLTWKRLSSTSWNRNLIIFMHLLRNVIKWPRWKRSSILGFVSPAVHPAGGVPCGPSNRRKGRGLSSDAHSCIAFGNVTALCLEGFCSTSSDENKRVDICRNIINDQ